MLNIPFTSRFIVVVGRITFSFQNFNSKIKLNKFSGHVFSITLLIQVLHRMKNELQKEKRCLQHEVREFKERYCMELWRVWRVLPICFTVHKPQVLETESKEINKPKYDPKKTDIKGGFTKRAVYIKRTRWRNAKRQEDGPRSSLDTQKRHNNILLPSHTVIKRPTLLWNKRLVRCISCLPLPPVPCRLREQSYGILFLKQEHANRNKVLRDHSRHNWSLCTYLVTRS
jgi:hypothetical protein